MFKSTLAKGTIILTAAGFLSRILGFFYRIWLSDHLGSELLGIYQMIFPISGVCYTIYASGIQTAISKITAERKASLIQTKQSEYYNEVMDAWKAEAPLTIEEAVWKEVKFNNSYELVTAE